MSKKEKGKGKTTYVQQDDPTLPFSTTIDRAELPSNYDGIPFDPQIQYGAQANGFYGNVRFKTFGSTRVFFFQIQPRRQNMTNYYTIIVVVPGKKSKLTPVEKQQLDIINGLCSQFESKNNDSVGLYSEEAVKFVNLATQYLSNQQGSDAWGQGIPSGTPVGMAIVFNQLDLGQLGEFHDPLNFPIATLDFNPPSGGRRKSKKRRHTKKRNTRKIRKTIRRRK
jgi:hypothetical protein